MIIKLAQIISTLNLSKSFSNIYRGKTIKTNNTFSKNDTLESARRNNDIQPLRYILKKSVPPKGSEYLRPAVNKNKKLGNLTDRRILKP